MGRDWFRATDWTPEVAAEFETRLARARPDSRPQYLRIQAVTLWNAGHAEVATGLLHRVLNDYDDDFEHPGVIELLGEIAQARGDFTEAEGQYRDLLSRWPELDRTTRAAEVFLADVMSQRGTEAADDEALDLLDRFLGRDRIVLNNVLCLWHLVRLRIAERRGDEAAVAESAQSAVALADSGLQFPRHEDVGTVHIDEVTLQRLRRLADGRRAP
jgi:tetratricopeptide (TPR) repeat protein